MGDELRGVNESPHAVGAPAVDYVAGVLPRNECGIPALRRRRLIACRRIEVAAVRRAAP